MFFTIYKTTNLVNGKYYYGKHVTKNLDDSYLGSGSALSKALKKYGKHSFIKEILFVFDNKEEMDLKEKEILNNNVLIDKNCYNMKPGGEGGSYKGINKNTRWINNGSINKKILLDEQIPKGWQLGLVVKPRKTNNSGGKKSKGKIWITNGIENTMIAPSDNIPDGWYKGRNNKFSEDRNKFSAGGRAHKGLIWINNGVINKKIKSDEFIENGWKRGRVKIETK